MPREQSKCREWEKERRNRLNESFASLSKLLPSYDPPVTVSKIDILKNAATFIEELQLKIKVLISESNEEAAKKVKGEEYKKLQDRIKRLLGKNEQLCCLLRQAKISIPPGCGVVKKFRSPLFWSNRIVPEQAKLLEKKDLEKENDASAKKTPRKFTNKKQNKVGGQNGTPKHRKAILNRSNSKKKQPRKKKVKPLMPSKCVIVLSQPSLTQPCYVITNAPSNNILGGTSTVISNSGLISNPMVSSKATKTVSSMPSFGPGTLILANGTIMPLLSQQTVLPLASQIITRTPIILVPKNSTNSTTNTPTSTVSTCVKVLPRIKPKYCLTKTTQVNKVPIPALTSRYSNVEVVLKKSEPKIVKKVEKKTPTKETEKVPPVETCEKRKLPTEEGTDAKKAKTVEEETVEEEPKKAPSPEPIAIPEKITEEPSKEIEKLEAPKIAETKKLEDNLDLSINHSELSNDIFASLQVPAGCQNPESTSPTAAFLLAFPLVSSLTGVKVTEVTEEDNTDSQRETPTLLQIGTMDSTKPTQSETLTPSLLNLDNLSFFSSKDIGGFYNSFETSTTTAVTSTISTNSVKEVQEKKVEYQTLQQVVQQQHQQSRQQHPQSLQQQQTKPQQQQQRHPLSLQQPQAKPQQNLQQQQQQQHPQSLQQQQTKPQQTMQQQHQQNPQSLQQQQQPKPQQHPQLQQLSLQQQQQSHQQQSQQLLQQPKQQQQHRQDKTRLVPCFDSHSTVPNFGTVVTTSSLTHTPISYQLKPMEAKQQGACANNYNQKTFPCNTFNEGSKGTNKNYPEPLYTNSTYSNTDTNFNQTYYKDIPKSDNRSYYSLNYENYADYRKNDTNSTNTYFPTSNYYSNTNYSKEKFNPNTNTNNNQKPKNSSQTRPPINWMTTPDNRLQTPTDYVLPQFTKESEFYPSNTFTNTQTTYFNTNPMYPANTNEAITNQEPRKIDLSLPPAVNTYQRNDVEDNQFTWSPTKIPQFLDPPHSFVSSTLPTLVGDLALGNPLTFNEQKDKCVKKDRRVKYEGNQGNFLSVSQLVDHGKEVPARTTARRNSGGRSSGTATAKKVPQKPQRKESKDVYGSNNSKIEVGKGMKQLYSGGEVFCDPSQKNRVSKNNYSAEALIGSQMQDKRQQNYNNKPISVSSFLHDNIIPYFPSVDLPQDNSYIQPNQTYQTSSFAHNFPSTFQNNTYTANSFIPTTTITSSYNFMHDVTTHDYDLFPAVSKDKTCKNINKNVREQQCTTKKSKRKHSNELPGFVDFPSFLSMPSSINSPILPDDFHTHTGFLQPTPQLYPCKNPFTKPNDLGSGALLPLPPVPGTRGNIQHPEISPINNAGTSLTNFNLSTIFPEINNKGALDAYSEPRVKENARSYTSTVQVSFNDKPTFSFSYINSSTSQTYSNQ